MKPEAKLAAAAGTANRAVSDLLLDYQTGMLWTPTRGELNFCILDSLLGSPSGSVPKTRGLPAAAIRQEES